MTTNVTDTGVGTVRLGILGGGFMARVHAGAARSNRARLTAVATSDRARSHVAAEALGADAAMTTGELIVSDDVDVVHICTPNATHAALASAAIGAGKHVICEKPLATTVADAAALREAADRAGVVAAVPFVYRYHPMVREARARVAAGEIGALLSVDCSYLQDWMLSSSDDDWRADASAGGPSRAFADIGSHLCDLVEFVAGEQIVRLTARTRRVFDERGGRAVGNEDVAAVLFETASGALGTALISQMAPGRKNSLTLELHGSERSLRFAQERPEELWIGARTGSQLLQRDPSVDAPDSARLQSVPAGHPLGYVDAFAAFMADVYAAVAGGAPEGMPTFADGYRAAVLTDAVLISAREQTWIETAA